VISRYRVLFSIPGFRRLLLSSVLGRLPSGMFSLAVLLFVHARTGSFLVAGVAVGAFSFAGAVCGPPLGALVDRIGQRRVLLPSAGAQAALLAALVLVGEVGAPAVAVVATAALAGAVQPPIAGCVRALWSEVAADEQALETVYALDATSQEVIWTLGPLLAGTTAALISPATAVLLCAVVVLCGTAFFATSTLSSDWRATERKRSTGGALANPGLRPLLGTVLLAGVVIGAVEVGLPALAVRAGSRWSAGPLLALFSLGSMAGGLLYSARSWHVSLELRHRWTLVLMAVAVTPLIAVHSPVGAFVLSTLAGLGVAPMLSSQLSLVGALAAAGTTTEAFTWHRAATIAGMAAGSALGGSLIDAGGAAGPFALGCASVALAFLLATLWRRRIDPTANPSRRAPSAARRPLLGEDAEAGAFGNAPRERVAS
jgi:MFS family permease